MFSRIGPTKIEKLWKSVPPSYQLPTSQTPGQSARKARMRVALGCHSTRRKQSQAPQALNIRYFVYTDCNICNRGHVCGMELIRIYQCFCDATRLRIIHLLTHGPLCVCHFQDILECPQVKVSQQLAHLRKYGLVEATRHANWMIYNLPAKRPPELEANLKCLQDCAQTDRRFRADLKRLKAVGKESKWVAEALAAKCC